MSPADADWVDFDIPGGTEPVSLARLRVEEGSGAMSLLVRFPGGWERPVPGHYDIAEELIVLDGVLTLSGREYAAGEWVWLPPGYHRSGYAVGAGVLAFARFFGTTRWVPGGKSAASVDAEHRSLDAVPPGTLLRKSETDAASIVAPPVAGQRAVADTELFDLDDHRWAWIAAGGEFPQFRGRCFSRTYTQKYGVA